MERRGDIVLLGGPPGAGKSTICEILAERAPLGVHIPIDVIRHWVIAGHASPAGPWNPEVERQFSLATAIAFDAAKAHASAGALVLMDHVFRVQDLEFARSAGLQHAHGFLLLPSVESNLERNRQRQNKEFDPEILVPSIVGLQRHIREDLNPSAMGWTVLDTSDQTAQETADHIWRAIGR